MNPTFLAHTIKLGDHDWLESSNYANSEIYQKVLEDQGYQVLEVTDLEDFKTW